MGMQQTKSKLTYLKIYVTKRNVALATTCLAILIFAFIFSIVYSAQNVSFGLLDGTDITWKDGNVILSVPFFVKNHGFYDIQDVTVLFQIMTSEGRVFDESLNTFGTIKAGTEYRDYLNITINPVNFALNVYWADLMRDKAVKIKVTAFLNYAFSWITLKAEAITTITFESLVESLINHCLSFALNKTDGNILSGLKMDNLSLHDYNTTHSVLLVELSAEKRIPIHLEFNASARAYNEEQVVGRMEIRFTTDADRFFVGTIKMFVLKQIEFGQTISVEITFFSVSISYGPFVMRYETGNQ